MYLPTEVLVKIREFLNKQKGIKDLINCLEYPIVNEDEYAEYQIYIKGKKKHYLLHRVSYQIENNIDIKSTDIILHKCDNKCCINPLHLVLGTHQDNVNDRVTKKRSAVGERNGRSKLTKDQVLEIRNSSLNNAELSRKFQVDRKLIRQIKKREIWKHI